MVNPKILIFVSKTGGGHVSLAEALRDRLSPCCSVEMVDPQPGVVHYHYRLLSREALWLWELEFKLSNRPGRSLLAHRTFTLMMERRVAKAITAAQPDLIITTYPFLTWEIVSAMRKQRRLVPFVMLQADPNRVHQSWLTERNAEAVLCPTRENYEQTLQAGFSPEKVHLSGWPVRMQFYQVAQADGAQLLEQMNLKPGRFTVFLQGGGEGAAHFVRTVENLLAVEDIQVILAAGTNRALLKRFQSTDRMHVQPFTREIAPIMASADVVMGKAGPNILFESVALGKPFIATSYIPGQEKPNLEFIERHRLGWVALKAEAQRSLVEALVSEPSRMEETKAAVAAYDAWNSARVDTIRPLVEGLLKG
jgi:UDP-N-acetylglucosamine:LPS N-acetylglucosamine transferase